MTVGLIAVFPTDSMIDTILSCSQLYPLGWTKNGTKLCDYTQEWSTLSGSELQATFQPAHPSLGTGTWNRRLEGISWIKKHAGSEFLESWGSITVLEKSIPFIWGLQVEIECLDPVDHCVILYHCCAKKKTQRTTCLWDQRKPHEKIVNVAFSEAITKSLAITSVGAWAQAIPSSKSAQVVGFLVFCLYLGSQWKTE